MPRHCFCFDCGKLCSVRCSKLPPLPPDGRVSSRTTATSKLSRAALVCLPVTKPLSLFLLITIHCDSRASGLRSKELSKGNKKPGETLVLVIMATWEQDHLSGSQRSECVLGLNCPPSSHRGDGSFVTAGPRFHLTYHTAGSHLHSLNRRRCETREKTNRSYISQCERD